jgi:hypothetical protein
VGSALCEIGESESKNSRKTKHLVMLLACKKAFPTARVSTIVRGLFLRRSP